MMSCGLIVNCSFTSRQKGSLTVSVAVRRLVTPRSPLPASADPSVGKIESAVAPPAKPLRKVRRRVMEESGFRFSCGFILDTSMLKQDCVYIYEVWCVELTAFFT